MPHEAKKKLADVHPDNNFKTNCGSEIKNLNELLKTLREISNESFKKHVNDEKNDFAHWVEDSVHDPELAELMRETDDLEATISLVHDRVEFLKHKAGQVEEDLMPPAYGGEDEAPQGDSDDEHLEEVGYSKDKQYKQQEDDGPSEDEQHKEEEDEPSEDKQEAAILDAEAKLEKNPIRIALDRVQRETAESAELHPMQRAKGHLTDNLVPLIVGFVAGALLGLLVGLIIG